MVSYFLIRSSYVFLWFRKLAEGSDRFRQVLRFTCARDDKVTGLSELIYSQIKFTNEDSVVTGTFLQLNKIQVVVAVGTKEIQVYRAPHAHTLWSFQRCLAYHETIPRKKKINPNPKTSRSNPHPSPLLSPPDGHSLISFRNVIQKPRAIKLRFCQTFLVSNVIVNYFMSKHCCAKSSVALHRPFWHRKKSAILSVKTMPYTLYTLNRANSPKLKPFRKIKRILLDFMGNWSQIA